MEMPHVTCRGRDTAQNSRHESLLLILLLLFRLLLFPLLLYNPSTLYPLYTFSFLSSEKARKETTRWKHNGEGEIVDNNNKKITFEKEMETRQQILK